jgi:hypothetical protein
MNALPRKVCRQTCFLANDTGPLAPLYTLFANPKGPRRALKKAHSICG